MNILVGLISVGGARRLRALVAACGLIGGCVALSPPAPETPTAPPVEIDALAVLPIPRPADPPPPAPPAPVADPPPPPSPEPVAAPPPAAPPAPPPPVVPPPSEEEQQALVLLADLQRLVVASAEELKREMAAANQAMARGRNDAAKVKLAMLLSMPNGGVNDEARALGLLEQVIGKSPASTPTRQIASLLHATLTERLREVREEQKKTDAVQQKLDALKAVERSLLGRERRPANAAPRTPSTNSK